MLTDLDVITAATDKTTRTPWVLRQAKFASTTDQVTYARQLTKNTIVNHPKFDDAILLSW